MFHRKAGGKRNRLMADFIIGAYTLRQADRLLTRDRGIIVRTSWGWNSLS